MKLDIITPSLKKLNRTLNYALLVFFVSFVGLSVSLWFGENELVKPVYFTALLLTILSGSASLILAVFRVLRKKTMELDTSEIQELVIHSQIDIEKIPSEDQMQLCGFEIITHPERTVYEITGENAKILLEGEKPFAVTLKNNKVSTWDMSPRELFKELFSMI